MENRMKRLHKLNAIISALVSLLGFNLRCLIDSIFIVYLTKKEHENT